MKTIGILGTGLMGKSIAVHAAIKGYDIFLYSNRTNNDERDLPKEIKGRMRNETISTHELVFSKVHINSDLNELKKCDLIIEVLSESLDEKRSALVNFKRYFPNNVIVASNTSSLDVRDIFDGIVDRKQVFGIHFFNPIKHMKLVEVGYLEESSRYNIDLVMNFVRSLEKEPILLKASKGYVVNKLLITMINQASKLLENNSLRPEEIDQCMVLGANHPTGPLKLSDYIGNDIVLRILENLSTDDTSIQISKYLQDLVKEKKLGRKTKIGFYDYFD